MKKIPHAIVNPVKSLTLLSKADIDGLTSTRSDLFARFRHCALAVLNTDSERDDAAEIEADFSDFDIRVLPQPRGLALEIFNSPAQSFVDGKMLRGIQEHLFAALRDIVYTDYKITSAQAEPPSASETTDNVFRILRNASVVKANQTPKMVVCWGGHSIPREEYDFSKLVGYELGLRGLDIVTGCGIGAMKGPMKGAAVGHGKQQNKEGRYIGISEPGIIAAESPNATVNELVVMPDIEKRLEAFVRLAHVIVVFPGGVGTVEEVLYLLTIQMHPDNSDVVSLIFAGSEACRAYFEGLDRFLVDCLGEAVRDHYEIIIGSPVQVGRSCRDTVEAVHQSRQESGQAYCFNWEMYIPPELQTPFSPTHENMAALQLHSTMPPYELASALRSAFSGLVAGNVKAFGIEQVRLQGPYQLNGDKQIISSIDTLLRQLVAQGRMKLGVDEADYQPCYQLVSR